MSDEKDILRERAARLGRDIETLRSSILLYRGLIDRHEARLEALVEEREDLYDAMEKVKR